MHIVFVELNGAGRPLLSSRLTLEHRCKKR